MPSMNAIRIRRYSRLCKVADTLLQQARDSGFDEPHAQRLARVEAIMEALRRRLSTGPRGYRSSCGTPGEETWMEASNTTTARVVDEAVAASLAEAHGLPEIEIEAAFAIERVELAESILSWIDEEEGKLTHRFGLLEGRKRYKPLRMLKSYARKYRIGRYGRGG